MAVIAVLAGNFTYSIINSQLFQCKSSAMQFLVVHGIDIIISVCNLVLGWIIWRRIKDNSCILSLRRVFLANEFCLRAVRQRVSRCSSSHEPSSQDQRVSKPSVLLVRRSVQIRILMFGFIVYAVCEFLWYAFHDLVKKPQYGLFDCYNTYLVSCRWALWRANSFPAFASTRSAP